MYKATYNNSKTYKIFTFSLTENYLANKKIKQTFEQIDKRTFLPNRLLKRNERRYNDIV